MKITRKKLRLLAMFVVAAGALLVVRWWWGNVWQRITVSPETTHVVGPLRDDGTVDYVAALNEYYGRGVTHENNAAVPLMLAVDRTGDPLWKKTAEILNEPQLADPQAGTPHFASYPDYRQKRDKGVYDSKKSLAWSDEIESMGNSPWKPADHPDAARWLDQEKDVLDRVVAATDRSRFFLPYANNHETETVFSARFEGSTCRYLAEALAARAQRRFADDDLSGAVGDIHAILRLGMLNTQRGSALERFIGFSIIDLGLKSQIGMWTAGVITPEKAKPWRDSMDALGKIPTMTECIDLYDRFCILDQYVATSRFGFDQAGGYSDEPIRRANSFTFGVLPVHFDQAMREANAWVDRCVAAAALPNFNDREDAFAQIAADLKAMEASRGTSPQEILRRFPAIFLDDYRRNFRQRDFQVCQMELNLDALQAPAFFAGRDINPQALDAFAASLPRDRFNDMPVHAHWDNRILTLSIPTPKPLPESAILNGQPIGSGSKQRKLEASIKLR